MPDTTPTTYILRYKTPNGDVTTVDDDGYDNRFTTRTRAALQVLQIFPREGVPSTIVEAKRFAILVRDAPLGEDVVHTPSGLTFRTVDSKEW